MRDSGSRILVDRYLFQTIWLVWFDNMMVRLKVFPVKFRADYFPIHFLLKTVMTECPNKLINKSLLHVKAKRKGNNTNISKLSESITFLIITNIITRAKWSEIDDQSWYYDFRIKCKEDFLSDLFQVIVRIIFWHRIEILELNGLVPTRKSSWISINNPKGINLPSPHL